MQLQMQSVCLDMDMMAFVFIFPQQINITMFGVMETSITITT